MICAKCGQHNAEDSRFCSQCGTQLRPTDASGASPENTTVIRSTAFDDPADASGIDSRVPAPASPLAAPGREAPSESTESTGSMDALQPGSAILVVKRGPNAGSRYVLDIEVTTAGRHPDSDIFLDDVTVSRRHAEFRRAEGRFSVHDVGSLNGTYLNRERIDGSTLANGDEVQIGKFRLVFLAGPRPAPAGATGNRGTTGTADGGRPGGGGTTR